MRFVLSTSYKKNPVVYPRLCYTTVLGVEDKRDFKVGPRSIDDYVLVYVTQGLFFCDQADVHYRVSPGEYILIDLHERHRYYFDPEIPSEIYWMHINGEQVTSMIQTLDVISPLPILGNDARILEYIKMAIHLQKQEGTDEFGYSLHIVKMLMHILGSVYQRQTRAARSPEENAFREAFEGLLSTASLSELSLQSMSRHMHLSKYYFSHLFKQYYGMPPMKYLLNKKLEMAKNLLERTALKVTAISSECGFSSPDYFSTAFKREYGVSPNEYRGMFLGDGQP